MQNSTRLTPALRRRAGRIGSCGAMLCALALLGGCRLIDQETFGAPRPPAPDALQQALNSDGAAPLIVIHPDDPTPFDQPLRQAIEAARDHAGVSRFRVVAAAPPGPSPAKTAASLRAAADAAEPVMDAMLADGVPSERMSLSAQSTPGLTQPQIAVFAAR